MILARPPFQLRSLPIPIRWEATRRHPYYQINWKIASRHFSGESSGQAELLLAMGGAAILASIGVSGNPPPPSIEFDRLDETGLQPTWLSGAVHPITLKGLAGTLLTALPPESLARLAVILTNASASATDEAPFPQMTSFMELLRMQDPALNSYPDEPFVSINPASSVRQIHEALTPLLKQWKAERGLSERRDRSEKFGTYFVAWDLREGFSNGAYHPEQEKTLKQVAQELKQSLDTAENHYRRAFELITGHEYSAENWYQIFGALKLSSLLDQSTGRVSRRRPIQNRVRRDVPQSKLGESPTVEPATLETGELEHCQLFHDICALIGNDKSNDAIIEALDLTEAAHSAIDRIRRHLDRP